MKKMLSGLVTLLVLVCISSVGLAKDLKVIEMIYSDNAPAKAGGNIFFREVYVPRINKELEKLGYKLDITMYHASSLYKYKDQVNALEKGLIEITGFICSWEEARAPLHMILTMPMMGYGDPVAHQTIWFDLQENVPEFGKEFRNYQELFHMSVAPAIFNMNEVRRVPADFKGVKVSATGVTADFFKVVGAAPLRIDAPDWYSSIDRGMIEVLPLGAFIINMWKIDEVAKVHVIPVGDAITWTSMSFIMSQRYFSRLPKEVQQVIKDNKRSASSEMTKIDDGNRIRSIQKFKDEGNKVVDLTPAEVKLWQEAAIPAHEKWIKEMEAKGLPGKKVYEETKRLIKKYN